MKDAIGYLRVSTREQAAAGWDWQPSATRSKLLRYAKGSPSSRGTRMCKPARERMRCCCDRGLQEH